MFKKSKILTLVVSLLLVLSLTLTGCSSSSNTPPAEPQQQAQQPSDQQPSNQQPSDQQPSAPQPSAPTVESNLLDWADWSAKMSGTINKDYYVIDLRTPDEIGLEKSLEGSINIDANETLAKGNDAIIDEKLANVPKDATILVHCKSGGRVKGNLQKFLDKGYVNAFGLNGWTSFDTKGYMGAAKIDANTQQLKPDAWTAKMVGTIGQDYYVVDVRDKSEYEAGHIQGAINIGVRDQWTVDHAAAAAALESAVPNKDALVLVHCAVGKRAKIAQAHMKAAGYTNVVILDNAIKIAADGSYTFE